MRAGARGAGHRCFVGRTLGAAAATTVVRVPGAPHGDGLRIQSSTTFRIDRAASAVHVESTTTLTNESPNTVSGGFLQQIYFPDFGFPVLAGATAMSASKADGTPLDVQIEPSELEWMSFAVVDLAPNLFYRDSQTIRLRYDLPNTPPRSETLTRANGAFITFPVFAVGDPGITDIEVVVPPGFETELVGDEMDKRERDGATTYVAAGIDDPRSFTTFVVARDDDRLVNTVLKVADADVAVHAWPNDAPWGEFVAGLIERGLPELEDRIGQPWPVEDQLDIIETVSPYLYGYGGWYKLDDDAIEVGDELEAPVILHELAHAWFNEDLFASRWINEAFADELAAQVLTALGEDAPVPEHVDVRRAGRDQAERLGRPDVSRRVERGRGALRVQHVVRGAACDRGRDRSGAPA